jgi:putative FmdB family regulatory protein
MPTYEYLCPACGVVEALQSMRDAPLTLCPACGKEPVTKLVSAGAGVIFKGSGFWETDYNRGKDYGTAAKKDTATAPTPSGTGGATAAADKPPAPEPKPALKPEAPSPAAGGKKHKP